MTPPTFPTLIEPGLLPGDDRHHAATISWASEACERGVLTLAELRALVRTIVKMRTTCADTRNSVAIADYAADCVAYAKGAR